MASQESLTSMAKTALGMARVRAQESRRPDRLFDDPYAQAFLAAAPCAFPDEQPVAGGLASLGAVFFFHKQRVLAAQHAVPHCQRIVLPADLRQDWPGALTSTGFQATQPTAWLAEGLLIYLAADQAAHLLTTVGELSAPASQLAFEQGTIADASLLAQARAIPAMDQFTSLWKGGLGAHAPDWLTRHGWQVQTHDRAALAAGYGRAVPDSSSGGFVTAVRRAGL